MPSFLQVVSHTPLWVWPLMVFVIWLGLQGLRPRVIPWWRLANLLRHARRSMVVAPCA